MNIFLKENKVHKLKIFHSGEEKIFASNLVLSLIIKFLYISITYNTIKENKIYSNKMNVGA